MNIWRHRKTNNLYTIVGYCKEEFFDGRFERLNSFEYDNGIIVLKNSGEF